MRYPKITTAFGIVGLGMLVSANNAQAATFTVPGYGTYDITTLTTTFSKSSARLESQPWWGNLMEAGTFANTVGSSLGLTNGGNAGPYFAISSVSNSVEYNIYTIGPIPSVLPLTSQLLSYAVVATPEPSEVLGTLALGIIGLAYKFKRPSFIK